MLLTSTRNASLGRAGARWPRRATSADYVGVYLYEGVSAQSERHLTEFDKLDFEVILFFAGFSGMPACSFEAFTKLSKFKGAAPSPPPAAARKSGIKVEFVCHRSRHELGYSHPALVEYLFLDTHRCFEALSRSTSA